MQHSDKNQQQEQPKWDEVDIFTTEELEVLDTNEASECMVRVEKVPKKKVNPEEDSIAGQSVVELLRTEAKEGSWRGMAHYCLSIFKEGREEQASWVINFLRIKSLNNQVLSKEQLRGIKTLFSINAPIGVLDGSWTPQVLKFIASAPKLLITELAVDVGHEKYVAFLDGLSNDKRISLDYYKGCNGSEWDLQLACHPAVGSLAVRNQFPSEVTKEGTKRLSKLSEALVKSNLASISMKLHHEEIIVPCFNNILSNKKIVSVNMVLLNMFLSKVSVHVNFTLPKGCRHLLNLSVSTSITVRMDNYTGCDSSEGFATENFVAQNRAAFKKTCVAIRGIDAALSNSKLSEEKKREYYNQYCKVFSSMRLISHIYPSIDLLDLGENASYVQKEIKDTYPSVMKLWRSFPLFLYGKPNHSSGTHLFELPQELISYIMHYVRFDDINLQSSK